jgi:hypothetical protein
MNTLLHPRWPHGAATRTDDGNAGTQAIIAMLPAEAFGPLVGELSATIDALISLENGLGSLAQDLALTSQTALDLALWTGEDSARIQQANALKPEIALIGVIGVAIRGQTELIQATTVEITGLASEIHASYGRARSVEGDTVVVLLDRHRSVAPRNRRGEERAAELLDSLVTLLLLIEEQGVLQRTITARLADIRDRLARIRSLAAQRTAPATASHA